MLSPAPSPIPQSQSKLLLNYTVYYHLLSSFQGLCYQSDGRCHLNATCTLNDTLQNVCSCKPGYNGNGVEHDACKDLCHLYNGGCHPNVTCTMNDMLDIICSSKPGLNGDGNGPNDYEDPCIVNVNYGANHSNATCASHDTLLSKITIIIILVVYKQLHYRKRLAFW